MKKCFIYVIAAISALVVSCNKEVDTPDNNTGKVDQNLVSMTFKAAMEGPATKTTLDVDDGSVAWAATDQVKFIWELDKTPNSAVSSNTEIDGDVATFTATVPSAFNMTEAEYKGEDDSKSLHLYAVYPSTVEVDYHKESDNGMHFFLTVPTEQDGTFANASIALAKWDNTNPAADLVFKNLCGLLQIKITDDSVRKIVLHSDDNIAGKMDITFTGPAVKEVSDGKKDITVNVTNVLDKDDIYYIAVLPTDASKRIGVTNMYVSLYNESGALIGDKTTTNELTVARKQIRKLGTIATDAVERFFVKATAAGAGDGSSWDNAADYAALKTKLTGNGACKIYMSAETFSGVTTTTIASDKTSSNYTIVGGFPSTNTGCDLSDRTLGGTILDGGGATQRFIIQYAGSLTVDGLTIQDLHTGGSGGGAVFVKGGTFHCKNCYFYSNSSTAKVGGAIHFEGSGFLNATNCIFGSAEKPNTAKTYGGAIYADGVVYISKCVFENNSAANGGAIFITTNGNAKLRDVSFTNNTATTNGSAIYGQGGDAGGATLFMDGCYFSFTDSNKIGALYAVAMNHANTTLGMNNCVVTGGWGSTAKGQLLNLGTGVIVNSNFFQQSASPDITVGSAGTLLVANSVVVNAGSSGNGKSFTNNGTLSLDHTLWNIMSAGTVTNASGNLAGVKVGSSGNFPNVIGTYKAWYNTDFNTMYGNDQTETASVSDCRSSVHYYKWNGVIPDSITDYSTFDMSSYLGSYLSSLVNTANSSFRTWIGDNLYVDIRGNARNTAAMWPGSYEE